jgi:hypothetical protein
MNWLSKGTVILSAFTLGLFACTGGSPKLASGPHVSATEHPVAFYYWKTQWTKSPTLERELKDRNVSQLYLRFFDVAWDDSLNSPTPISPIRFRDPLPKSIQIIPVVFIKNQVFEKLALKDVPELAKRVKSQIDALSESQFSVEQIQMDCDWSISTRDRYFAFLESFKKLTRTSQIQLSATIRLHQIKYPEKVGMPPVDRGMLMFYNMGELAAETEEPSIFNERDASRYTAWIKDYPLPLDLALPLFSWVIQSRQNRIVNLLENLHSEDLQNVRNLKETSPDHFIAGRSFYAHGRYFKKGDLLRVEALSQVQVQAAATLAAQNQNKTIPYGTIAFFDLNETTLKQYGSNDLHKMVSTFHD